MIQSFNPNDPSEVVFETAAATVEDGEAALAAGLAAQAGWASDPMLRLRGLTALGDELEARRQRFIDSPWRSRSGNPPRPLPTETWC